MQFGCSFHAHPGSSYNRKLTNNSGNLQIVSERFVEVTQALVLVPHTPNFAFLPFRNFCKNLLAGDIPRPLKNDSNFHPDSHEFFSKKLPLDGGFTLENRNKNSDKSRRI
jgi:hypothetical protein